MAIVKRKKSKERSIEAVRKAFVIAALRRYSLRWFARTEALRRARVERGLYKCENCGNLVRSKDKNLDHIDPVVAITGFTNWEDYINRMLCGPEGFAVLCVTCHEAKTNLEKELRKNARTKQKRKKRK